MGRNSESSKRSSMCEKILKAFGVYPKIVKFSQDDQEPNYKPYSQPIHVHVHAAPEMEKKQKPANNVNNSHIGGETTKEKLAHKISGSGGGGGGGEDVNDVFSDYINRAKRRLVNSISSKRSSQSHDSSGSSRGKENAKDDRRFSDYIIRARNKLKATASSNVGWSRGMRGLQISLNQTQKIRLQRALETLESISSKANSDASVIVADTIPLNYEDGVLKGHGTLDLNGEVVATICGVVERVNKLIYVRSLRARYKPEVGDIIVGRVTEVAPKRWRLDINYSQDAVLMLSSMNLPDGIQRRRTAVDELNMRTIFEENDVICAEVRGFQHDGLHLQARSQKYGKLEIGQLLTVSPYLVKRRKQHFHHLEQYGIDLILGCNGFIWIGEHVGSTEDMMIEDQVDKSEQKGSKVQERGHTPLETRQNICRIANAIRVLYILGFIISVEVILETVSLSISLNMDVHEMLGSEFCVLTAEKEAERRTSSKKRG